MWNGVPFLASPIDTLMLDQARAVISLVVFVRQTFITASSRIWAETSALLLHEETPQRFRILVIMVDQGY